MALQANARAIHGGAASTVIAPSIKLWASDHGDVPQAMLPVISGHTRLMGHFNYTLPCDTKDPHIVWANFYQNAATSPNQEISNPDTVILSETAVAVGSSFIAVDYSSSSSVTVAAGANDFESDTVDGSTFGFTGNVWPKGTVIDVRWEGDFGNAAGYVPVGSKSNIGPNDQMFSFTPANDNPQVYATGAMTPPTGSSNVAIFAPVGVVGTVPSTCTPVLYPGDSIGFGGDDTPGIGLNGRSVGTAGNINGGGFMRRAAHAANIPSLNMTVGGNRATWIASQFTLRQAYFKYFPYFVTEPGQNDAAGGVTAASIIIASKTVWASMNSLGYQGAGAKGIYQTLTLPKTDTSNYHQTDIVNQVDIPSYDAIVATLNGTGTNSWKAQIGATAHLTDIVDIVTPLVDSGTPTAWKTQAFTTTTAASISIGATSASLTLCPNISDTLVFDPGLSTVDMDNYVTSITGSGPCTVTFSGAFVNAHSSGASVRGTGSYDGTHPTAQNHVQYMTDPLYNLELTFH